MYELDLARSLLNVATSFGELNRHEPQLAAATDAAVRNRAEAVAAVGEAVLIRRDLQRRNPGIFEPILAKTLTRLSERHAEAGRRQEALDTRQEAVDILRSLAEQAPDPRTPQGFGRRPS